MGQKINDDVLDLHAPFTYELSYDPTGNGGNGSMSTIFNVTSGGVQQTFTPSIDFPPGVKDSFPDLNRYGLMTLWLPQNDSEIEFYWDEITYTASPPVTDPTDYEWIKASGGNWNDSTNWSLGYIPESTDSAIFGSAITNPSTVFTETALAVNALRFNNASSYGVAGNGNVTPGAIEVVLGDHVFQLPVNLGPSTNVDVATNTSVTFENALNLGGNAATKTGGGDHARQ